MTISANHHPQAKPAVIKEYQGHQAILETEDLQVIRWPIVQLPSGAAIGDTVFLVLHSSKGQNEERVELAHKILNEIFSADTNDHPAARS